MPPPLMSPSAMDTFFGPSATPIYPVAAPPRPRHRTPPALPGISHRPLKRLQPPVFRGMPKSQIYRHHGIILCFHCGRAGHRVRDCPLIPRGPIPDAQNSLLPGRRGFCPQCGGPSAPNTLCVECILRR